MLGGCCESPESSVSAVHCQRLPENWCLNEPEARSFLTAFHNLTTGNPTPLQQLRRLADSDGDELDLKQGQAEGHKTSSGCDPSLQCCIPLHTESPLFRWIPRHLPFFLLALFRVATKPNVFAPRQEWRRPRAPAFSGAFPAPPFVPDEVEQDEWLSEDHSSVYLFDMTSSGLGHGVPESMCRATPAMVELATYFLTEGLPFASSLNSDNTGTGLPSKALCNYMMTTNTVWYLFLPSLVFPKPLSFCFRASFALHGAQFRGA